MLLTFLSDLYKCCTYLINLREKNIRKICYNIIVKNFKENKKTIKILKKGNLDRFYSSGS